MNSIDAAHGAVPSRALSRRSRSSALVLSLIAAVSGPALAGGPANRGDVGRQLDIRVFRDDSALIVRHAQNFIASDCTITLNKTFRLTDARIAGGYNSFAFDGFADADGTTFDPAAMPLERVFVQCLRPSLRVRSVR